jgi:PelA/Pel-15E family pectate lyase
LNVKARTLFPALGLAGVVLISGCASPNGHNSLTANPKFHEAEWQKYVELSNERMKADKAALAAELAANHLTEPIEPATVRDFGFDSGNSDSWFAGPEGRRIADIILSFQTPTGGWSKHVSMTDKPRRPGEQFAGGRNWSYVGTIDNDATITQLRFLARVNTVTHERKYEESFLRGVEYLLMSQYPNGGWPQVYPLQGGYHDHITFNDDAMINVMSLLRDIGARKREFAFVPGRLAERADRSVERGLQCILDCQLVIDGKLTVWGQQHDARSLKPAPARNYEMISQCARESSGILEYLMEIENPTAPVVRSVDRAAEWLTKVAIYDHKWGRPEPGSSRKYFEAKGAGPIWARYYEIGTDRPLFGDRDKSIHYDVSEISQERQNGYSWYNDGPAKALRMYEDWRTRHVHGTFRSPPGAK